MNQHRPSPDPVAHRYRLHESETAMTAERDRKAVRVVAGHARGPAECVELLAMLGLDARVTGKPRRGGR
ncbi:MAG TPA: hypothetical protein VGM60_14010 [Pseudonocardia sp.]|jgi:hypothetical protein|uniref:hypothetical protein n=1 Tax=Pseudonocardia sp. TaxID=60912 RepID=UPI002F4155D7